METKKPLRILDVENVVVNLPSITLMNIQFISTLVIPKFLIFFSQYLVTGLAGVYNILVIQKSILNIYTRRMPGMTGNTSSSTGVQKLPSR